MSCTCSGSFSKYDHSFSISGMADSVLAILLLKHFCQHLQVCAVTVHVSYPSLNFSSFDKPVVKEEIEDLIPPTAKCVFLSINRYERKKNLNLALEALDWLRNIISDKEWKDVHLVMAGKQ